VLPDGGRLITSLSPTFARSGRQWGAKSNVRKSGTGQDRPIFAPARSRSQGPLSDQVADAPNPRGQCRSWVDSDGSISVPRTAGIGVT
jgi:hypothetical protein